ncbi:MAG: hypothetical protein ABI203_01090 [Mucilaginibacter sp.]
MENNIKTENLAQQEELLEETYKDDFWSKKYDVTKEELKKIGKIGISALIIEAGARRKTFSLE